MKKILFILFAFLFALISKGQLSYPDSLLQVIRSSKDAQKRLETARFHTWYHGNKSPDSIYYCAQQLARIGQELSYPDMLAYGKSYTGWSFYLNDKKFEALKQCVEALKLADQHPNDLLYAYTYQLLGNIYTDFNHDKSTQYLKKALSKIATREGPAINIHKMALLSGISTSFRIIKQWDSAMAYANRAVEISMQIKDSSIHRGGIYTRLGRIYLEQNQPQLALAYYKLDMEEASRFKEPRAITQAIQNFIRYYLNTGILDSALFYCNRLDSTCRSHNILPLWEELLSEQRYKIYKNFGRDQDALHYLEMYKSINEKTDSIAQNQKTQVLLFEEEMRQQELEQEKTQNAEDRKRNLQYAAIALGSVAFMILYFLFSHSIIANQKIIRFLGVLALLIVFEFLNLLLHPYLGNVTEHSPFLMLLAMVSIAALLIPLHHRLEHLISHQLVEKNKKIRLAAAKKTIEILERDGGSSV